MTTTDPARTGVRPAEHFVARLEDLPLNAVHQVELEGRLIGVIRTDESVHAIGNACPHQGGPMCFGQVTGTMVASTPDEYVYDRHGLVIRCPWHAYEFDLETGASVGGVLSGRIAVFETVVRDGDVYCVLRRVGLKGR